MVRLALHLLALDRRSLHSHPLRDGRPTTKHETCLAAPGSSRGAPRRPAGLAIALCALLAGLTGSVCAQALVLEVHALRYRTAEQVLPVIAPLVASPGSVSGLQNQLVVRAPAQTQADVRAVLERIDTAPRRLLVSVRHDDTARSQASGVTAQGQAVLGRTSGGSLDLRVQDTRASAADQGIQQIQVLEGQPAVIRSGQSTPVPVRQTIRGADGVVRVVETIDYRDTGSSVQVLPRLAGEQVVLDILPERAEPARGAGVAVQRLSTQVSGRLGEWIELGGVTRDASAQQSTLLGSTTRSGQESRRTWVRVEELR